ncbi:MAG TPA: FAD-binding oxidoreductase [Candidatus Saccharimonadales bacterium]|jgi:FAD/FMN-containing dehydrogenase
MSKVAHYLQEHLLGEVLTSPSVRRYFSTDGGVFQLAPQVVVYPRNTSDVRKVARFTWQLAERGKILPITARGKGSDQGGAAIGSGVMLVFPAHMNKLLELDTGKGIVRVQPGIIYQTLQNVLHTHGRFLPPYPSSIDFATLGGAVANNTAGEKTVKYGATKNYVRELDVVLANGELIHTLRLTKRELNKKKGLTNFEGEIYRQMDGLITDNWDLIHSRQLNVTKDTTGYNLVDVKRKDGSFDLTPLMVGSQGTLGIVTQAAFDTEAYNPNTSLLSAHFADLDTAKKAIDLILPLKPSALEIVDSNLLDFVHKHNPKQLTGLLEPPFAKFILLIEFDDINDRKQKRSVKRTRKILESLAREFSLARDEHEREMLWKIRHSAAAIIWHVEGRKKALPIIEDGIVPRDKLEDYLKGIYKIFEHHKLEVAVWGHAGDSNMHMQPFLDLGSVGDRQRVFKIMDDYYNLVISLGGSTAGEHNDGRLRAPYLPKLFGPEGYELLKKTKQIFDPYGTLNPGVKIDVKREDVAPLLRNEYTMEHLSDHMPRT